MKLYIKYMVSYRCKMYVNEELLKVGLHAFKIEQGEVEVFELLSPEQHTQLKKALLEVGLELIDDAKAILIDKIMMVIIRVVHYNKDRLITNFSDYLSKELDYNYTYLANLFSDVTGTTIEHCLISHKIEKVKELILYDELSLTDIAEKLNYSSVGHLSTQFKKVTGLTPTFFKNMKYKKRIPLENVCTDKC